jgi:nicotinamide phosphoribosyltransferase
LRDKKKLTIALADCGVHFFLLLSQLTMAAKGRKMMRACNDNILLVVDSYKVAHHLQYPPGTSKVVSYFECRGGPWKKPVFFGLQYLLKEWFTGVVLTKEKIAEAKEVYKAHFGEEIFNEAGWLRVLAKHGGHLPICINAVLEGTCVDVQNVLFTVENTDDEFPWLTNWFETLLVEAWYPMTVATNSREQKKVIARFLHETSDSMNSLEFKLHDFGFRGVSSVESAAIGGLSHLVNFSGTDTIAAVILGRQAYHCSMAGFSIPASEHSTITTWKRENEKQAFENMLDRFPKGLVACVSDSYNIWHACRYTWGETLRAKVASRDGTLVIRPDSGDPPEVVVKCLEILGHCFKYTINSKGYKVLPPCVRLIQGDGVNIESMEKILKYVRKFGWSAENVTFGSGGALLQKLNRDTMKCAYKCSFALVDGVPREVYKEPVTDMGKVSKRGRLALQKNMDSSYSTVEVFQLVGENQLKPVFRNGELLIDQTLADIRKRAELSKHEFDKPFPALDGVEEWATDASMEKFRQEWRLL